jgi:hypothetical protein
LDKFAIVKSLRLESALQAPESKSLLEILHSPENLSAFPLGPNSCRLRSDVAGPNGLSHPNSSGPKTESKSDSSFFIDELASSIFFKSAGPALAAISNPRHHEGFSNFRTGQNNKYLKPIHRVLVVGHIKTTLVI